MAIVTGNPIGLLLTLTYTVSGGGPVTLVIADSWHAHFADGPMDVAPFREGTNTEIFQWWVTDIGQLKRKRRRR